MARPPAERQDLAGAPDPRRPSGAARPADPDSRARTHLANERTFLAWLRTGLSLILLGLGAAQFLERDLVAGFPATEAFAALLVAGGVALTAFGGARYERAREQIDVGAYRAASGSVVVAVVLVAVAGAAALALVVLLRFRG